MSRYDPANNKKSSVGIVFMAIILITIASVAWFYFEKQQNNDLTESESRILALPSVFKGADAPKTTETEAVSNTKTTIDNIAELQQEESFILPDLDNSDALLREEIAGASPQLAEWLNTDQLIRKYVVITNDFSQGLRIEKHMRFLKLDQPFTVDQDSKGIFIAAKSYQRYDKLAAAINAMDVQATLAMYKKFRPLLLQVFGEFNYPDEYRLEDIFTKAAAVMLAAPVIEEPVILLKHANHYKFADPKLEALNPVHKQMIRMGPENTRIIKNKVRLLIEGFDALKE
jgi:hypothetical protein